MNIINSEHWARRTKCIKSEQSKTMIKDRYSLTCNNQLEDALNTETQHVCHFVVNGKSWSTFWLDAQEIVGKMANIPKKSILKRTQIIDKKRIIAEKVRQEELDENICVIGYASKIFRDDAKALSLHRGEHLIPWQGDTSLMIDRLVCAKWNFPGKYRSYLSTCAYLTV